MGESKWVIPIVVIWTEFRDIGLLFESPFAYLNPVKKRCQRGQKWFSGLTEPATAMA